MFCHLCLVDVETCPTIGVVSQFLSCLPLLVSALTVPWRLFCRTTRSRDMSILSHFTSYRYRLTVLLFLNSCNQHTLSEYRSLLPSHPLWSPTGGGFPPAPRDLRPPKLDPDAFRRSTRPRHTFVSSTRSPLSNADPERVNTFTCT